VRGGLTHYPYFQTAVIAMETAQVALNPYQAFQAQPMRNEMSMHYVKNYS